ncbi:MAG: NmrA family transcriptional regulator, partial [Planctomycetota bacterium]|nr:NmrA family transcriptional regulator [Planctomycetota bacterium]
DVDDIADVAVAALTEPGHARKLYELTGPKPMTFADAVAEISTATRRSLSFLEIPAESYAEGLTELDVPEEMAALVMYLFGTVLDGRNSSLANGVQEALGRAPRNFADYARETASTGAWEMSQ